ALLAGQSDPAALAELARGRLREKRAELERALVRMVRPHHRFLLAELLAHWDYLDEAIGRVSAELEDRLRPFEAQVARLDSVPAASTASRIRDAAPSRHCILTSGPRWRPMSSASRGGRSWWH
ncbi:MAG TPA: hypothetical protein VHL09_15225, partial [Dehalococcoidia bacterium]|nr:hypothetical protein [Dehalococcoidia bacterium]